MLMPGVRVLGVDPFPSLLPWSPRPLTRQPIGTRPPPVGDLAAVAAASGGCAGNWSIKATCVR
jgi:hypothetical protein